MTIFNWINEILVSKKHWNDFTEDEQKKLALAPLEKKVFTDKNPIIGPAIYKLYESIYKNDFNEIKMLLPNIKDVVEKKGVYERGKDIIYNRTTVGNLEFSQSKTHNIWDMEISKDGKIKIYSGIPVKKHIDNTISSCERICSYRAGMGIFVAPQRLIRCNNETKKKYMERKLTKYGKFSRSFTPEAYENTQGTSPTQSKSVIGRFYNKGGKRKTKRKKYKMQKTQRKKSKKNKTKRKMK